MKLIIITSSAALARSYVPQLDMNKYVIITSRNQWYQIIGYDSPIVMLLDVHRTDFNLQWLLQELKIRRAIIVRPYEKDVL